MTGQIYKENALKFSLSCISIAKIVTDLLIEMTV